MFTPSQLAGAPAIVDVPNSPYSQKRQFAVPFSEMSVSSMAYSTATYDSRGRPTDNDSD